LLFLPLTTFPPELLPELLPAVNGGSLEKQKACRPLLMVALATAALIGSVAALALSQQGSAPAGADMTAAVLEADDRVKEGDVHDVELIRKPKRDDSKNLMSKDEAQMLDTTAKDLDEFPNFSPMAPVIFPEEKGTHNLEIVDGLREVEDRKSTIILPDGTKVPFWHKTQVPYPIGHRAAKPGFDLTNYNDLAETPNFKVETKSQAVRRSYIAVALLLCVPLAIFNAHVDK